jgi:sugar phosphate isomerase/epimerase
MHPAVGVFASHADGFLNLASQVKARNLRFNLDTANQFCQKENVILSLHRLVGFVDYIHLSDNRGERPEHLQIGEGEIRWESFFRVLRKLKYKGKFGIDVECHDLKRLDDVYIRNARKVESLLADSSK